MEDLATKSNEQVEVIEADLVNDPEEDLTLEARQQFWLQRIEAQEFHFILVTPPCSTFSRVRMSNRRGPPPLRCRDHPRRFLWASNKHKAEIECGNIMVDFMIKVIQLASTLSPMPAVFTEHPEDLGATVREEDQAVLHPASIWLDGDNKSAGQGTPLHRGLHPMLLGGAVEETDTAHLQPGASPGVGPQRVADHEPGVRILGTSAGCQNLRPLVKQHNAEGFRTTGTAEYPIKVNEAIAQAAWQHYHQPPPSTSGGGHEKEEVKAKSTPKKQAVQEERPSEAGAANAVRPEKERRGGRGPPIEAYYKGKFRAIHDGGGLGSPGRWRLGQRTTETT